MVDKASKTMQVAGLQPKHKECVTFDQIQRNMEHTAEMIHGADSVDLYLLPELSTTGYGDDAFSNLSMSVGNNADTRQCRITRFYAELAAQVKAHIGFGLPIFNPDSGRYFMAYQVVGPDFQVVHRYDKLFLCNFGDSLEGKYFDQGAIKPSTFQIKDIKIGSMICAEQRFPEVARHLAHDLRADVILHPCAITQDNSYSSWHAFATTRALENHVYLLSVNFAGDSWGGSIFVPPWVDHSTQVQFLQDKEDIIYTTTCDARLTQAHQDYPFEAMREKSGFDQMIGSS